MFESFPKIPRLNRFVSVTEKIDGMNAQVFINRYVPVSRHSVALATGTIKGERIALYAGSRTKYLTRDDDNASSGFYSFVRKNAEELLRLGVGRHFGEWWGKGIGRGYGQSTRQWSLFNAGRWVEDKQGSRAPLRTDQQYAPRCCRVVPIISEGDYGIDLVVSDALETLKEEGSHAAPGYTNPEGVVAFHSAAKFCFKQTFKE